MMVMLIGASMGGSERAMTANASPFFPVHWTVQAWGAQSCVAVGMGSSEAAVTAKASVMPSRRDQRKQQDVKLMPPPPSLAPPARPAAPPQPQASTSGYTPPPWAGQPPRGTSLQVLKDGVPVQDIPLLLPATVFGRSALHTCHLTLLLPIFHSRTRLRTSRCSFRKHGGGTGLGGCHDFLEPYLIMLAARDLVTMLASTILLAAVHAVYVAACP